MEPVYKNTKSEKKRITKRSVLITILIIVILGAMGGLGYSYWNMKQQFKKLQMPEGIRELQKKQTEELLNKLKVHAVVPGDEDPIIATVTDADALKKQSAFYELAKNGDSVIIYAKAKKAYLYDSTADRVLNIGPVVTENK